MLAGVRGVDWDRKTLLINRQRITPDVEQGGHGIPVCKEGGHVQLGEEVGARTKYVR